MRALPFAFALQLSETEQQIIGVVLLASAAIGGVWFLLFKLVHVFETTWTFVEKASKRLVDFAFDIAEQVIRRYASLRKLRQELASAPESRANATPP